MVQMPVFVEQKFVIECICLYSCGFTVGRGYTIARDCNASLLVMCRWKHVSPLVNTSKVVLWFFALVLRYWDHYLWVCKEMMEILFICITVVLPQALESLVVDICGSFSIWLWKKEVPLSQHLVSYSNRWACIFRIVALFTLNLWDC